MSTFREILSKLFTRNVVVKRLPGGRLKAYDVNKSQMTGNEGSAYSSPVRWRSGRGMVSSGYGNGFTNEEIEAQRRQLYIDYELMDTNDIISSVLDIFSEESTTLSIDGELLVIKTDNEEIKKILHNLFYDVLNIEFNMWGWIRTMCKYGDAFLYMQLHEKFGVVNVTPIHPSLIVREEGTAENPDQIRFRYDGVYGYGTSTNSYFEAYEIAHFRLISDPLFLPYGKSVIYASIKTFKALTMTEDALLLHRIMRSPERRLFKIDVGNLPPEAIDAHIEQIVADTKKIPVIDPATGEYNLKFAMMSQLDDVYLPVRGGDSGTAIETLPGLENAGQIDDVEYFKNKLLAGLKVPKEYLGYSEGGESKCLHPETKIPLLNGTVKTVREIAEIFEHDENPDLWVYSFDFDANRAIPAKIKIAEKTRLNAELVRVHLDNGTFVDCTPDHNFLLKDGTMTPAAQLVEGSSLCAIYRRMHNMRKDSDYEQIYQPDTSRWEWTHSVVDEYINGKIIDNGLKDGVFDKHNLIIRHHVDFNRYNNNPTNLQRVSMREHSEIHCKNMQFGIHSPESKAKSKAALQSASHRQKMSVIQSNRINSNDEWRVRLRDFWLDLSPQQRSDIVKSGKTEDVFRVMSEHAKRRQFHLIGQQKLKEKYPNGRTDLHGENSVRWVSRPKFDVVLDWALNYEDKPKIDTLKKLASSMGYDYRIIKDSIESGGYTVNEFLNQYIGFKLGRHNDIKRQYLDEISANYTTAQEIATHFGISIRNLYKQIKKHYGTVDNWRTTTLGKCYNHKVVRVEILSERCDTYNLEVDNKFHNYLISSGIVIKNSNLAQTDIRFARTIERIQKIFVSELYKIAVIHLHTQGFETEQLIDFELFLTNPSLVFERQKTDTLVAKVDLVASMRENNLFSDKYIYENIFGLTEDVWKGERDRIIEDKKHAFRLKQIEEEGNDPKETGKSFGTPHDIASMQVASKFRATDGEDLKKLYTPDGREDNARPDQHTSSFETVRDQDFGRDPVGRRENEKMNMPKAESVKRILKLFKKKPQTPNILNEEQLFDDEA